MNDWQVEMADIIADVAANLVRKHGTDNRGILVLADFQGGVGYSVFVGKRKFIEYIDVTEDDFKNVDLLDEFRFLAPLTKRPVGIEIFIKDGKASSKIIYPEDVEVDKFVFHDVDPFVISYFGDYAIKYPQTPLNELQPPTSR